MSLIKRIKRLKQRSYTRGYAKAVKMYTLELKRQEQAHAKSIQKLLKSQAKETEGIARYRQQLQDALTKRDKLLFFLTDKVSKIKHYERQLKQAYDRSLKELSKGAAASNQLDLELQDIMAESADVK